MTGVYLVHFWEKLKIVKNVVTGPIVEKLNISTIYESIILIFFSVNLPLVFIYKFYLKEIKIYSPGEPREHI